MDVMWCDGVIHLVEQNGNEMELKWNGIEMKSSWNEM